MTQELSEVTTFPSRDAASQTSGTKVALPLQLEKEKLGAGSEALHATLRAHAMNNIDSWKSHSVLIMDMSGSMRRDDVSGARCRADGAWMAVAEGFVRKQMIEKTASSLDLISVILMREEADLVLAFEPLTWVLYNKMIDNREWTNTRMRPR